MLVRGRRRLVCLALLTRHSILTTSIASHPAFLMKHLKKLKAKLRSNKESDENPANRTNPTSLAQEGSGPSQLFRPGQQSALFEVNLPRPGFFAGARNVDASHGVFNNVARDQYNIKVDM
jgi:hypothetical protein